MIEFQNINKSYAGRLAVDGVSLRIERGEFVLLMGPSGSGKSTLLKMINRMESHDAGEILFAGQPINSFKPRDLRLRMGYAIQSVGLFPHWTVERNIATVPQLLGWSSEKIQSRVTELLEQFELDPEIYRKRLPHQLSGGQQQRVGVARALAADPDVLLMDEPFGALDPVMRIALQSEIQRIHRTTGKTIVMVSHDIDEALFLATKIVLLEHGRLVQVASPLELTSAPVNGFVMDFVGSSDIGIKRLSLRSAQTLARTESPQPGASLAGSATLREAVSFLAMKQIARVNLTDAAGAHAGVLYAADIFTPDGDKHG